jgi:hypothetical protein
MKFAEIIKAANVNPGEYPYASEFTCALYDDDGQQYSGEHVNFIKHLFAENEKSFLEFCIFLKKLNEHTKTEKIDVYIDNFRVILFWCSDKELYFSRTPGIDSLGILGIVE